MIHVLIDLYYLDADGDGYGDNQSDGATQVDDFPLNPTQWQDTDGDGYGDNQLGNNPDLFPNNLSVSISFTILPLQRTTTLQIDINQPI